MNLSWCFDLSQARWIVRLDLFRSTKTQETSLLISCNLWTYNKLKPKILAYYVVNFEILMNFDLSQAHWVVRLDLFKSTKTREPRLLLSCKLLTYNKLKPEILAYQCCKLRTYNELELMLWLEPSPLGCPLGPFQIY